MNDHKPTQPPESHRLIRCFGEDRRHQKFEVKGQFLPFDHTPGTRFCIQRGDGRFEPDRGTWNDTQRWEYADGSEK